jgi:predicted dehydrogenase
MDEVRVGVIGIGNVGSSHSRRLAGGEIEGATLAAVCDINPARLEWSKQNLSGEFETFEDAAEMMESGAVDAVVIATPHYDHPPLAIKGFEAGLHVLTEKPAGVYTRQVKEMNQAAAESDRVFAIMFQQRTGPVYRKLKDLIDSGELGELLRIDWITTGWYRTQRYYDSGGWRATWEGEGGGILMNQCPHDLDMLQWLFGMPDRLRATCFYGKYHDIEVEDEVFATMEYPNGAIGTFKASTGEAPGTRRLEVFCERGKLVLEGDLKLWRTRTPVPEHLQTSQQSFGKPECWECSIPVGRQSGPGHAIVLSRFVQAIKGEGELVARGEEGLKGVALADAMLLSSWTGDAWVEMPFDDDLFYEKLQEKIQASSGKARQVQDTVEDLEESYH